MIVTVKGQVFASEYSGCEGWRSWPIRDIAIECEEAHLEFEMLMMEKEVRAESTTYVRKQILWEGPE